MSGLEHRQAQAKTLRLALAAEDRRGDVVLVVNAGWVEGHQLVRSGRGFAGQH